MQNTTKILLDSSPIIKSAKKDRGYAAIDSMLKKIEENRVDGILSAISCCEIMFILGKNNEKEAGAMMARLENSPIKILPVTEEIAKKGANILLRNKELFLSIADAIIIATGMQENAEIITCDREWAKVKEAKVTIV